MKTQLGKRLARQRREESAQGALSSQLQQREAAGVCDLWYFDVAGFCLTPCVPYAWQPIGEVITVPTASHGRRLNVLGFLKRNNELVPYIVEGKIDTSIIVEAFEQFSHHLDKRTYVFLDNAPVHKSQEFVEHIAQWVQRGLIIKYLHFYALELIII